MDLIVALVWGSAPVIAASVATRRKWRGWHRYSDIRAKRDLLVALAMLFASGFAAVGIVAAVIVSPGPEWRRIVGGLAYGAFVAAIIVFSIETPENA